MQANAVHLRIALFENFAIPFEECRLPGPGRSAGDQLHAGVDGSHLPRGIHGLAAIFAGRHVADLPGAVHFVAQAPRLNRVGLRVAMFAAQIAPLGATRHVAIFHQRGRHLGRRGAEIGADQRLGANALGPGYEFIGAELVRLDGVPGSIEHRGPLIARAHAIQPVVAGNEVAARIANDRHAHAAHLRGNVFAEAGCIGECRTGIIDAAVNSATQVFQKTAPNAPVNGGPHAQWIDHNAVGRGLRPQQGGRRKHQRDKAPSSQHRKPSLYVEEILEASCWYSVSSARPRTALVGSKNWFSSIPTNSNAAKPVASMKP